eukprot:TRINITY_DN368_c0_g3_i2.p1 TRINITY_DN368_c0_g3~~TRINITY_DN368_c0_g3_i2.p1  ORF type:complete len:1432 (+),score=421.85 TRINITY_DN368_c0_g3_i2:103-4398(+)
MEEHHLRLVGKQTFALGVRRDLRETVLLGDDKIILAIGKRMVCYDLDTRKNVFISPGYRALKPTAFTTSISQKYLAVGESPISPHDGVGGSDGRRGGGEGRHRDVEEEEKEEGEEVDCNLPHVHVYSTKSWKRMRAIPFPPAYSNYTVKKLGLSLDHKILLAMTILESQKKQTAGDTQRKSSDECERGATEAKKACMHVFSLEKTRHISDVVIPTDTNNLIIKGNASSMVAVTSGPKSGCQMWRLSDSGTLKLVPFPSLPLAQTMSIAVSAWHENEFLIFVMSNGKLLVTSQGEVLCALSIPFPADTRLVPTSIISYSRGFIVSCSNGFLFAFEKADAKTFEFNKRFRLPSGEDILDMSMSPSEEHVICSGASGRIYRFSLANIELLHEDHENFFSLAVEGLQNGPVSDFDVCLQRPLLVTCSAEDPSIRVLDFEKRSIVLSKSLGFEQPSCISIHPMGFRILVGFPTHVAMYDILHQNIRICHKIQVRHARKIRFSHGGHLFFVVSANNIFVFSSMSLQLVHRLRGHSGTVMSAKWSDLDTHIITTGFEGSIFVWDAVKGTRLDSDVFTPKLQYPGATIVGSPESIAAVSNKMGVQQFFQGEIRGSITISQHPVDVVSSMQGSSLIVATEEGSILFVRWPLKGDAMVARADGIETGGEQNISGICYETFHLHSGAITNAMLSFDERYLFTSSRDGSLFVTQLVAQDNDKILGVKGIDYTIFGQTVLMTSEQITEQSQHIETLLREKTELDSSWEYKMKQLQMEYEEEIDRISTTLKESSAHYESEISNLMDEAARHASEWEIERQERSTSHSQQIEELSTQYGEKLHRETEESKHRQETLETKMVELEDSANEVAEIHRQELEMVRSQMERMQLDHKREIDELQDALMHTKEEYEEVLKQMEFECEKEVDKLNEKSAERTREDAEQTAALKSAATMHRRRVDSVKEEAARIRVECDKKEKIIESMKLKAENQQKLIDQLTAEIEMKNTLLASKERQIFGMKKQTTELEKLKFVLEFKFQEIRKEQAPKDAEIEKLSNHIKEMDKEIETLGVDKENLKKQIDAKAEKLEVVSEELQMQRLVNMTKSKTLESLVRELEIALSGHEDPKTLIENAKRVIKRLVTIETEEDAVEQDERQSAMHELERQRSYMEAQTLELKRQLQRKEKRQRTTQRKQFAESSSLLKEVNELRFENHNLHQKLSMLQAQLRTIQLHQKMTLGGTGSSFGKFEEEGMAMDRIANRSKSASMRDARSSTSSPSASVHDPSFSRSGRLSRPVSSSASTRTPDSFFQHRPSSRQGKLHRGSTAPMVRDAAEKRGSLEGFRVAELVKMLESNNAHIRGQEKEIQRLRSRLAELLHKDLGEDEHISLEGIPPRPASELGMRPKSGSHPSRPSTAKSTSHTESGIEDILKTPQLPRVEVEKSHQKKHSLPPV